MEVAAVILAGGRAERMGGGDKCLRPLGGRPLLSHVLERLRPQVEALVLNANGDPARFAAFGLPVLPDGVADQPGPLAGVLAGLEWAARLPDPPRRLLSVPGDSPFLPRDLVARLLAADGEGVTVAASGGRRHPVVALWPLALARPLRRALLEEGLRKVGVFAERQGGDSVDWPAAPLDPFFNANRPEDLAEAERLLPLVG